jgi:uncharacterized repeat protein (TIGR02543 family)
VPTLHDLAVDVIGQGTVDVDPDNASYLLGDVVQLLATPAAGWGFAGWSGALQGSENPTALTISGDVQVEASFFEFALIEDFESVNPGENAVDFLDTGAGNSLTEDDSLFAVQLLEGEQVLATSSTQINIHSHYSGVQLAGLDAYEFTGRMRLDDLAGGIGVTFSSQFPTSPDYYRLRSYLGSSFRLDSVGTSVSGVSDTGVVPAAGVWYRFRIQVEAGVEATDIRARIWAEGGSEPLQWQAQATDSSTTRLGSGTIGVWSMAAGSKSWDDLGVRSLPTAPTTTLGLDLVVLGGGQVIATPDQALYSPEDLVLLEAIADPGYFFAGWSGGASGTDASVEITMNEDKTVYAEFIEILPHTLDVSVVGDGSGTVTRSPDQLTYLTGEVVTLTADPAVGSRFEGWGGDIVAQSNPIALTILGPASVTAEFDRPEHTFTFENLSDGATPAGWLDTGANNSLVESPGLFTVRGVDGQQAFGTDSELMNQHSHWTGAGSEAFADYRYGGRFQITDAEGGIGFTILSQFPNQSSYYRLRRYAGTTLHLSPLGTSITRGTTDTGISPLPGVWYRFQIEVEDTGTETQIRAKVWTEGSPEPELFQIDAADESLSRLQAGTFGVWTMGPGSKVVDDVTLSVPEPGRVLMLAAGLALLGALGRRRRRASPHPG